MFWGSCCDRGVCFSSCVVSVGVFIVSSCGCFICKWGEGIVFLGYIVMFRKRLGNSIYRRYGVCYY